MAPAKKAGARGRQAAATANKVTKPAAKAPARRIGGRVVAAVEQALDEEGSENALIEKSANVQKKAPAGRGRKRAAVAVVEEEDEDVVMDDAPAPPLATPPGSDNNVIKSKGAPGRPKKAALVDEEAEVPDSATRPEPAKPPARAPPKGKRAPLVRKKKEEPVIVEEEEVADETEIPEMQQPGPADSFEADELEDTLERHSSVPSIETARNAPVVPMSVARRPPLPTYPSSPEKGDAALRRRLGEMTQKYESMELKYRDLREISVKEAERNFDRLRKQTEEKTKAADELIASLKADLVAQKEAAREAQRLKGQLEDSEAMVNDLQSKNAELTKALSEAKTENKALNMRLTAARTAEAAATAKNVPGSAMKGANAGSRMMGTSEAIQHATLNAQMKEDLYGDLTGLIVRSVKRDGGEDVYDCIQTGRNGTLHFKLAIGGGPDASATDNYDEAQFLYMPQLDANRDRALVDMLPDYLVEEISFPRQQAAKFYARVTKALTEQVN
ncbi:chromosome segregation protein Csm1/Pcs1-domain-containing protein [Podospora didyma]|uniref:Chromosome segregation protein Csm1/Pcs1-domain-containing protein n=1 Tax=Podospora didyma TaxID=330526 RepID=A0AAE0P091_9PEZI|nr:chromosome segregation protein Csm1/Pcs1-domain-containing protein [Podospora didyma]